MKRPSKVKLVSLLLLTVILAGMAAGCGRAKTSVANNDKDVELTWYYIGDESTEGQEVYAAANKIIKKEINATVNFMPISIGEYAQKMQLKSSASEPFDLCYTADGGVFAYYDNAKKGAFLPIDELLAKYAPKTQSMIPEKIWNGVKISDKTYAVPNYQVSFRQPVWAFKKELVEKYNLQSAIDNAKTLEDFTPIFEIIKEKEPGIIPSGSSPLAFLYMLGRKDDFYDRPVSAVPIGVDKDLNVLDLTEGKARKESLSKEKLAREWNKKGFFHKDVGIAKDFNQELKAGKFFATVDVYKPGLEADMELRNGYPVYIKILGDPIISTGSISATLTAISRTSKNPERAVQFLELINSNKELYNLIIYGIEGKHYKKTGEDSIEITKDTKYKTYPWAMGCQFNAYRLPGQPSGVWEQTIKCNEEALPAPLLGFHFDADLIKTEIANVKTAIQPNDSSITWGLTDDYEKIGVETRAKMDKDLQIIKKEIEKQVEEFKKSKK